MLRITLPTKLDPESIQTTLMAIKSANCNESSKVIVLQGQNDIFCLGMSFDYLANSIDDTVHQAIDLFAELIREIYVSKKPTIALVQGKALAGGAGLAAACDVVIADHQATFGFSEILFGLLPGIIMPFLLQRMLPQKAKQLILSATTITAAQALAHGLIDELVSTSELEHTLQKKIKYFSRINSQMVGKIKALLIDTINLQLDNALQKGRNLLKEALADTQLIDNIRDYTEKGIIPWENATYDIN